MDPQSSDTRSMADIFAPFPSCYSTRSAWKVQKPVTTYKSVKSRRGPKAKSWTRNEEAFLLEARQHRVAYRSIAQHLQKTELACRLHYHQLVVVRPQNNNSDQIPGRSQSVATTSSTCSPKIEDIPYPRRTASPPSTDSVRSDLSSWLDQVRNQRSLSVPIPLRQRCTTTPPPLDLTKKEKPIKRDGVIAFITPPTPPTSHQFTPPVSCSSNSSGFTLPPLSATVTSSPSTASPACLTPSPTFSNGTDTSSWRSHSSRWSSVDLSSCGGGLPSAWLMPSPATLCGGNMTPSVANSDRCSVHSLLNYDG